MKVFKAYTAIFGFLISSVSYAQNTVEETRSSDVVKEIGYLNMAQNQNVNPTQIIRNSNQLNNIYITQIGSNNSSSIRSTTTSSTIDLRQHGNNNTAKLNFTALSATETFHQSGDNNFLATYGNTPSLNLERTINQSGYGQRLTIHGNNSISEKMKLNMNGATSTIIIRNFN